MDAQTEVVFESNCSSNYNPTSDCFFFTKLATDGLTGLQADLRPCPMVRFDWIVLLTGFLSFTGSLGKDYLFKALE